MAIGEARPGYELWRPNREKASSQTTRFLIVLLMVVSAVLMLLVAFGGWPVLNGGSRYGIILIALSALYLLNAYLIFKWSRGALSLTVAIAVLMFIFAAIGFGSWFDRNKAGFDEGALPSELLGVFVIIFALVQIVLTVACSLGVNQEWHVEVERPIGSGDDVTPPASSPGPGSATATSA
ncbi:MAG: hypothetical protein KDB62_02610 [Solirubrobacterales bacterium]|nr:hypothetical protein [Solirubrobacterales bacterium]